MPWDIIAKVVASIASAAVLTVLAFFWRAIHDALFFTRVEYDLPAERGPSERPFSRTWDITWQEQRLTFEAGDISIDHVAGAVFKMEFQGPETFDRLFPKDKFRPLFRNKLQVKINSIVRRSGGSSKSYLLRLVLRRRRRFFG
jgi:hypothetical protein